LAAVLTLVLPGLGHLYAGFLIAALGWWAAWILSFTVAVVVLVRWDAAPANVIVAAAIAIGFLIASIVDAARKARRSPADSHNRRYLWVPILLLWVFPGAWVVRSVVRSRLFATYWVPTAGMSPGVMRGDYLLVLPRRTAKPPRRWDVVTHITTDGSNQVLMRRVAALPGETVEVRSKILWIDGRHIPDPYARHIDPETFSATSGARDSLLRDQYGPSRVPADAVFLLGDNRDNSLDSRFRGPVSLADLRGDVRRIYWSRDPETKEIRWDRIGRGVR
jgi:signal peptidase I